MKTFREAIRHKDLAITAEVPLQPSTTASDVCEAAEVLKPSVDAVQFGDNRYSPVHMSPLAAARIALDNRVDAIVQLSCRDRNRIALQADLLGAEALGIASVILVRGEKISDDTPVHAKGVFDTNLAQLIALARTQPSVRIGAFVTVFDPNDGWEAERIEDKLDSGVTFLQTQSCLNAALLRRYVNKLVERRITRRAPLVVEVPLLTSMQEARLVRKTVKGVPIPDAAVERIATADNPVSEGISVCAGMLRELQEIPGISGINIHYQRDPHDVVAALQQADLVSPE